MFGTVIYFITNDPALRRDHELYSIAPLEKALSWLNETDEVYIDTETTGFDAHASKLLSIQIGNEEDQYIVDAQTINLSPLKPVLESKLLVGHYLKFDLKFLFAQGIYPRKVYDTFVAEKLLHCGLPDIRAGLDWVTQRYTGRQLDKSIRTNIAEEGLTPRVIQYAANDVAVLPGIKTKQEELIKAKDIGGAVNLENRFTPALAYIEYCGLYLDASKWKEKMAKDQRELEEAETALNTWVGHHGLPGFSESQLDLFEPAVYKINWSSSQEVWELFKLMGVPYPESEGNQKWIETSFLGKHADKSPLIPLYLRYRKAQKVVHMYGENFLRQRHLVTGRLHSSFNQILDTGRISSGGKNSQTGEEFINFQNIPSDPVTRSCFCAEPGNVLVMADYSAQEQVVLANKAMDPTLLQFYDKGWGDMHSFVASKMYPELEGIRLEDIKIKHPEKRQAAKLVGFTINYGGTGHTIAERLGLSREEGERIYRAYFEAFPGLKAYFERIKKQGIKDGYILVSEVTKRKCYLPYLEKFREMEKQLTPDFWDNYRVAKAENSVALDALKTIVRDYFVYKGEMERKALNFPIQGTAAEINKISCVYIFKWILEKGLFGVVKFVNTVHDENVLECPEAMKEEVAAVVKDAMCRAADIFCKRVPLLVEPDVCSYWRK